jgi:hypothetical protein
MAKKGSGKAIAWIRAHVSYIGDECLIWPFSRNVRHGYGYLGDNGKIKRAHKVMCEMVHGPAPSPLHHAAHSCGNGKGGCINPQHISWKTPSENMLDKRKHGTARAGLGRKGKLTAEQVLQIRKLEGKLSQIAIAKQFNITESNVMKIHQRKTWAHIS